MSSQYNPKRVLRKLSWPLVRGLFERQGLQAPESNRPGSAPKVEAILAAWQDLPEDKRQEVEVLLQDLHAFGQEEHLKTLMEVAVSRGIHLPQAFHELESRQDKALWIWLNGFQDWEHVLQFNLAEDHFGGRYWEEFTELPRVEPRTSAENLEGLGQAISGYHFRTQGRGDRVRVEHLLREGPRDYFFVYLSDYTGINLELDSSNRLKRLSQRQVFEVVYAFDRTQGRLDLFARGGKRTLDTLRYAFGREILNVELHPTQSDKPIYCLNPLIHMREFPTDPLDGIESVCMRDLRIRPYGTKRIDHTFHCTQPQGLDELHDEVHRYLRKDRLRPSLVEVARVKFAFELFRKGRRRVLLFTIALPNRCDLRSKRIECQALVQKYLHKWGLHAHDRY